MYLPNDDNGQAKGQVMSPPQKSLSLSETELRCDLHIDDCQNQSNTPKSKHILDTLRHPASMGLGALWI
jgi:hypothetical protein